ncbi:hypothetical protein [Hasllibacter sp. MH4015]|uniref:SecDF P1 head subdomain-containing protein n=1 Tax=Hasllibacter sp. MH4015 TaxID=2854029 RepID=UPI001CD2BDF5|nr:hypothetical protein [Hasllibacter sp. MH4015]
MIRTLTLLILIFGLPLPLAAQGSAVLEIASPSDTRLVQPSDMVRAEPGFDPSTGQPLLTLQFAPAMAAWFEAETAEHIGERIELRVCGEVVTAPVVREVIPGGTVVVTGSFTAQETEALAARLSGAAPCAD